MFAQQCTITAPVPRPWAWAALTDAQNLASWSPIGDCDFGELGALAVGDEVCCTVDVLGRPVGATLCVVDLQPDHCLGVRIEMLAATVFETVTLTPQGASKTEVDYRFDVLTPVPGPAMQAWFQSHALATCQGLLDFLQPEHAGVGAVLPARDGM